MGMHIQFHNADRFPGLVIRVKTKETIEIDWDPNGREGRQPMVTYGPGSGRSAETDETSPKND